MRYDNRVMIGEREVALDQPTYFIADIGSNHEGDIGRAKALVRLAAEAGADAAKFQHFLAPKIVSDYGFRHLGGQIGHQAAWDKPVVEVYRQYEFNRDWNQALADEAAAAGIAFMTTPYDEEAIRTCAPLVPAFKVGSGDITWTPSLTRIAAAGKPVLLATGAATLDDVDRAVDAILGQIRQIVLMQCNTNYTGSVDNFRYQNLRVLRTYALRWPGMVLGLSDHTSGHAAVLGAVALGARVIEKHFTDDNARAGPDHSFAMNPASWREMVVRTRELELALGDGSKRIEANERDTVVVQRRCLRLCADRPAGHKLAADDLDALRPAPDGALAPFRQDDVIGRALKVDKPAGDALYAHDLEGLDA